MQSDNKPRQHERERPFIVFAAIDLRHGRVVRLQEGDPTRETAFSSDPASTAAKWIDAGARWLHVVDLDAALGEGSAANRSAIGSILALAAEEGAQVQLGGGLRSLSAVENAIQQGATRVVLGTAAVEYPEVLEQALLRWGPERVAASLDARDGWVRLRGWQEASRLRAMDLALRLRAAGLRRLVYTDIARDGLERGLNLPATAALARACGLDVIASGGARSLNDLRRARDAGLAGVILGRALYSGAIDPAMAFAMNHA
jgi:phosphoribosylformimino-5-aminoimidazole carboxamide ribotide isomerase